MPNFIDFQSFRWIMMFKYGNYYSFFVLQPLEMFNYQFFHEIRIFWIIEALFKLLHETLVDLNPLTNFFFPMRNSIHTVSNICADNEVKFFWPVVVECFKNSTYYISKHKNEHV